MSENCSMESRKEEWARTDSFSKLCRLYKPIKALGYGGCGWVLKAARRSDGLEVAVKVVDKRSLSPFMRRALAVEVFVLRAVQSSQTVRLVEAFEDVKYVYIVMELARGCDLYRQMKKMKRSFHEHEALTIVEGVLEALVHLHEQGIAHRDLKLENVMLVDENRLTTKLIDFGLAHLQQNGGHGLSTDFCGTRQYCSPEVASKRPYVPEQVDMWSVGVVLYALIARTLPFLASDSATLQQAICQHEVQFPGAAWDRVSECTQELIRALLAKNPAQRPSAEECLRVVRAILHRDETQIAVHARKALMTGRGQGPAAPIDGFVGAFINVLNFHWLQPAQAHA